MRGSARSRSSPRRRRGRRRRSPAGAEAGERAGEMSVMVLERGAPLDTEGVEPMPRGGIIASAAMHIGIFVLIIVGLPSLFRPQIPDDQPIAVELVTITAETHATKLHA